MRQIALALLAFCFASPSFAVTYQFATPIAGDSVLVTLELTDVASGAEIRVSIPPGAGDLLGVFGNVTPESLLSTMDVSDPDDVVTQWQLGPKNKVWKVGAGNVMAPVKTWDWGLQLGFPGCGSGGPIESARFVLTGVSVAQLTGASTQGWVFGVRIQSTDGAEGSAKIGMPVGTPPQGEAPSIEITSPADGATLGTAEVAVSGTVSGTAPTVTVNGQAAAVTGSTFSTTLTLSDGAHTLTATATNAAGTASDSITVSIDTAGPLITITAPAAGALTHQTPVVVTGAVADASPVTSVTINGASFPVSGGAFSGSASLAEGANTIAVSAVDALGNPGQASVAVTLDTIPPVVTIATPPDGALTTQAAILTEGSVSDASAIAAFVVNGQATALGAGNAFSTTLALAVGANALTASATDAAGNMGSATVTVTRGSAPAASITSPAAGFLTSQASAVVTGTAPGAGSISVNGVAAALTGGAFSATVPLTEGVNTLTATATNAFGSAQAQVGGTRDSTPPVVTITGPADGSETTEATVFVVGTVADASPIASLTIDGDPIAPGSSFNVSAALSEGANTIVVAATDAAGNSGSASVTVTRQSAEPLAVTITSPPDGSLVSQPRIAVAGTVSPAGASVVVNGVQATVTGESFTAAAVPLSEGPNTLTATATRESATASDSTGVTLNLPPEISITSPLDGAVLREATTDVEGFVSDALALVDVNGVQARVDSGGRFVAEDLPLDAGPNDLVARAIDLQGAQASDRAAVERDDAAGPALRVVVGFFYNFEPYPSDPSSFLGDPATRLVTFATTDEWLAAMAEIGRPASGFLPAADLPVVRGAADSVLLFVLSEEPAEPSLDFVFPDGHPSDYITSDYQGGGPAAALLEHPLFEFFPPERIANPEALAPSDLEAGYYHLFLLTRPVDQPDGPQSAPPPYSAPLVIRASQEAGSDSITVFWDEQDVVTALAAPGPDSQVSGASIAASGPAADEHALAAATYRVLHFGFGATAIDLGAGEGAISDGRFHVTDAPLGLGNNQLFVNVHDATSWSTSLGQNVLRDPSAPDVQLVNPHDGQALVEETASLALSFGSPLTLVSVNGTPDGRAFPVGVAEDALSVSLALGPNPITLEVDAGSGSTFFTFVLYRVASLDPPRITSPAHRSFVNTDTLAVEGVVPLGTPYVEVNGVPGTIDPGGVRFTATIPVPRDLGFYLPGIDVVARPLVVTAVAYPQSTSASLEVTPDFTPPEFRLVLPEDGSATLEEAIAYGGWVSEAATVTLAHAGGEAVRTTLRDRAREGEDFLNFFGGIQFHRFDFAPVAVSTGPNTVTLTARDQAGNESQLTLDLERFAAALALTSPTVPVPALATDLVFDVVAPVTLQGMFVNGRFLPSTRQLALAAGIATIENVPLEPGTNALRLVYSQAGGPQQVLNLAVESSSTVLSVVTGRAIDPATGEGIWGALVTLEIDGQTILVATAPDGSFRVVVPPGEVAGSVRALGYATATFVLTLAGGETVDAQVSLAAFGGSVPPARPEEVELLATVRDAASSAPLQGVTLEALGEGLGAIDVTDSAGLAELSSIRVGEQSFRLRRRGFLDAFATRRIDPPATGATVSTTFDIDWTASEFGTLAIDTNATGTVIDGLTRRPLAGAQVEARDVVTSQLVGTTGADAEGRFTLAGLPKFATLEVTATHPDHAPQAIEAFVVPRGDERLDFHLRATGAGRIEGTITDASTGLPIALANVGLPAAPLRTVSEGDGLFVLVNAPAGTYDLAVTHPAYFPATIAGVAVSSGGTSTASAALQPRPKTGGIYGVVRRAAGDLPVPGATIAASSGPTTTADAEGKFALAGLPAGLEQFTVSAPGFTPRVKTAVVDADVDAVTPTQRYVELDLSAAPLEATAAVPIEGGSLELPDGSVRIDFPPLALSGDARVTLARRAAPELSAGESLAMDTALGIDAGVAVLGEEFVLRIESATPGATAPFFVGPILVSGRYSATASAAIAGREDVAFPVYYDADQGHWTVPRVVPHLHLVDTVNRLSVTGLSMLVTETGAPVTARLVSPEPIQLAGFVGLPVIRQEREIVMALARKLAPLIGIDRVALVHGLAPDDLTFLGQQLDEANRWDQNAQPLLVFHGWSPASAIWNVQPEPKAAILERYAQIMGDLARGTDGVYRPAYATYNTRLGLEALGNLVATRVAQQEDSGALRGVRSDPEDPLTGPLFGSYEAFGFSMGGLIERAYQRQVNGTRQQIRSMVTMGTPHHGGLQQVRNTVTGALLAETGFLGPAALETLLALWSPGTADLLDYSDLACRFVGADFTGNPTLCRMNRDFLTAPSHRLSLIAGTDSISLTGLFDQFAGVLDEPRFREVVEEIRDAIPDPLLLGPGLNAIGDLASVGFAATGCVQSDGVVCVWSAHARTGPRGGDSTVPALASVVAKEPSRRDFNHLEGGGEGQPISVFADDDIFPILSDHFVGRLHDETHFVAPTEDEVGEVRFQVGVEYNAPQGDITGLVAVVYGRYEVTPGQFAWKILAGADEDGEPDSLSLLEIEDQNSVGGDEESETLKAENLALPLIDPSDPSTRIDLVQTVLVGIGPDHPTVPLEPGEDSRHLPGPPAPPP